MICSFCQSENPAQAGFCRACGVELKLAAPPSAHGGTTADALPRGAVLAGVYAVERVLGQGGFGITYCCHDQMLDRRVAVKEFFPAGCHRQASEVQASRALSGAHFSEARAQFLAEARLLARCHHAGIVSVYTAFEANQTAYMTMEMLHGRDLSQLLQSRGGRLGEAEAVPLIERAGEALQFVHETGLLHRDIKPENIIVCDDGRVMLIDFGTAREYIKGQAQGHTIVVTPGYAPLEQYARQAQRGAFTDVYGLAATLYHLLCGVAPPAASDRAMGVRLRPVREENSQISRGVAHAVEVALQMEIARRPQSVREFLDLMRAPATGASRLATDTKTALAPQNTAAGAHPGNTATGNTGSANTGSGNTGLDAEAAAMDAAFDEAEMAWQTATGFSPLFLPTELETRRQLLASLSPDPSPVKLAPPTPFPQTSLPQTSLPTANASLPTTSGATPQLSPYTMSGYATRNAPATDNSGLWAFGAAVVAFVGIIGLVSYNSPRTSAPQPTYVSSYPSNFSNSRPSMSNSFPRRPPGMSRPEMSRSETAARREMESTPAILPASVETLPGNEKSPGNTKVSAVLRQGVAEFSPDGQRLAYVDREGAVRVWDRVKHEVVRSLPLVANQNPVNLLFSRDNQSLVVTYQNQGSNDQIQAWNLRTGKLLGAIVSNPQNEWLSAQTVLPDGKVLFFQWVLGVSPGSSSRYADGPGLLWDPATGKRSASPIKASGGVGYVALSPDGKQFVTADRHGRLRWLDARTGAQKSERRTSLTYGDYAVSNFSTGNNSSVVSSNTPLPVEALRFSGDGSALAARNRMQISVFNAKGQEIRTLPAAYAPELAVSNDGKFLAEGGNREDETRNLLWNVREGRKTRLLAPTGRLSALNFSRDGKQVFGLSTADNRISLVTWKVDAKPMAAFSAPEVSASLSSFSIFSPAVSAASQLVATSSGNAVEVHRFDGSLLSSGDLGGDIRGRISFSPDGRLLAFGLSDGRARILNAQSGQLVCQLEKREAPKITSKGNLTASKPRSSVGLLESQLVFSADNSLLASIKNAENQNRVELWSLSKQPRRIASFDLVEPVVAVAFSADNKSLICGNLDGSMRWYDVATQKLQGQISKEIDGNHADSISLAKGPGNVPVWASQIVATAQQITFALARGRMIAVRRYDMQPVGKTRNRDSKASTLPQKSGFSLQKEAQISLLSSNPFLNQFALSPDGQFFVTKHSSVPVGISGFSNSNQSGLSVWNVATGALVQKLPFSTSSGDMMADFMSEISDISVSSDSDQITCLKVDRRTRQSQIITWRRPSAR